MTRRKTPYDHLLARFERLCLAIEAPRRREMYVLPMADMDTKGYRFADVAQRTQAADRLGWDVRLRWDQERGLVIEYVERLVMP